MSSPLVLGIDGGGTSTVVWLAGAEGDVLGRGRAGPSNVKAVGLENAREAMRRAIGSAFADAGRPLAPVDVACLGLAGFGRPEDQALLLDWCREENWARRIVAVTDGDLVVAAGTPQGWGLAVIAGTGSIALGRSADGRKARAGGWGPLFGDEGSAYAVAVAALRRLAQRLDGRLPTPITPDPLAVHLCSALGIADPSGLVAAIYAPSSDRARIAGLAPSVVRAAAEDPELDRMILEPAGHDLAEAAIAVARALGWTLGPVPLALAGGFLLAAPSVSRALLGRLDREGYDVDVRAVPDPVAGALILARRALFGSPAGPLGPEDAGD